MNNTYEMDPLYASQKSFYGKAYITEYPDGRKVLTSYATQVAEITADGKAILYGKWSQTTTRHQKEFLRQNGFSVNDLSKYFV